MNFISLFQPRPLLSNLLSKKFIHGRSSQVAFLSRTWTVKPNLLGSGQTMKNHFMTKHSASNWAEKALAQQSHDHSSMWLLERVSSIGSITSFVAMYLYPCENADLFFSLMVSIHVHLGIDAIMIDYLRPAVVGNFIPKLIPVLSVLLSASMIYLLAWVAIYGNGIAGSLQQLWYLNPSIEPYDEEDSKLLKKVVKS